MADSLKAIIGAIYFDEEDLGVTRRFVRKILDELLHILLTQDVRGSVTPLKEINQKRYGKTPRYDIARVSGGSHNPVFKAEVYVDDEKVAEAKGRIQEGGQEEGGEEGPVSDNELGLAYVLLEEMFFLKRAFSMVRTGRSSLLLSCLRCSRSLR